jgi:aconitate hydratase
VDGSPVHLRDIWPTSQEIEGVIQSNLSPQMFTDAYADVVTGDERWQGLGSPTGLTFPWDAESTYIRRPPYLDALAARPAPTGDLVGARVLAKVGDSVTTDHISPAGAIPPSSVAGQYLLGLGVPRAQLNTFASRRGNHLVMMRGTFANPRLRNQLTPEIEGGFTRSFVADGAVTSIFEAAEAYRSAGVPLVVLAGAEYGTGSSRDWAAKGTALLGVRAVIAQSFERIHRSNLVGMGVLPLEFLPGESAETIGFTGEEHISILGLSGMADGPVPETATVHADERTFTVQVRIDTEREANYYRHGGVMPYVLRGLAST